MRPKLLLLLLIASSFSFAQQSLTREQINRLADAGKVYGYIKYFHPYLQYNDINWDSIFVSKVDEIIQARNKSEYAAVMKQMLSVLNDNLTTVVNPGKDDSVYHMKPSTYNLEDSIGYININDVNDNTYNTVQKAYENIDKEKGIVFDMRKPVNSKFTYFQTPGTIVDWTIIFPDRPLFLFKGDVLVPSLRTVYHKGSYETAFKQKSVFKITGKAQKNITLVFIVSSEDEIPLSAIGLQQKGLAAIIREDSKELVPGKASSFYIQDSLIVKMRVAEAVNADGSLSVVHPNAVYSATGNPNLAIELARNMIINGFERRSISAQAAPQAISQSEETLTETNFPSVGRRMLAAAKIFAVIDNFHPAKDLMDRGWDESYSSTVAKFIEARDSLDYLRAVAELYSNINDSHGFITYGTVSLKLNPVIQGRGSFVSPVITDVVENKLVVTGIYNDSVCRKVGIKKGDVILSIDGNDPIRQIEEARKYQPSSTKANQTFFISKFLLFGSQGQIRKLKVIGSDGKIRGVDLPNLKEFNGDWSNDDYTLDIFSQHTKPAFKLLSKDIGYVDLTSPISSEGMSMFNMFKNTKAVIFDDRGYPRANFNFRVKTKNLNAVLAKYVTSVAVSPNIEEIGSPQKNIKETSTADQDNKDWNGNYMDDAGAYSGKIVMLINEAPQSYGEDIALKSKTSGNTILIGSPTSGTNGGMTSFVIPGNITLWYSEEIASYPDGKRTQRIGVLPDIYVCPTVKGIQAGKDEVLDRAVKYIQTGK